MGSSSRSESCSCARTILAVDDEPLILRLVEYTLARQGFSVLTAGGGREALGVLRSGVQSIDLLITDIVMPEIDGTVLAQAVLETNPGLPVLFISGYSEQLNRVQAPVLAKPFSSGALVAKVRLLLGLETQSAGN